MATIYKRGCKCDEENCTCGKKWTFVIDIGKNARTGRRRQKSKGGFNTREDAEAAAAAFKNKLEHGTYRENSDILFKDFAKEWLPNYIERIAPKPGTIRIREYGINKLMYYFAYVKLNKITEDMYQEAINDLKDQNLARSTIEGIHATGKMIFKIAISKKMIKENPTENSYIKKDRQIIIESDEEELPKYFEKDELIQFLNAVKEKGLYMDYLIFITLSYTGMRVGELVALKWKDIDFNKQTIRITKTYYNPKNNTKKFELVPPKTKKSRRKIHVDPLVIEELAKHKEKQERIIARLGNKYKEQGFIFANVNRHPGYPILIKLVENRMARILAHVDLNYTLTPHSLRHTHTSLLAEAKVDIEDIMDRLGHIDDEVTRKVYLHVTAKMKKEASEKFSELLRS